MSQKKRALKHRKRNERQSPALRVVTIRARYVFLDIVGFTRNRSVEAQSDLVKALNKIVRAALDQCHIKKIIVLPTGDGMCIAIESPLELDIHVRLALRILGLLEEYNGEQADSPRKFQLRIGVNENDDNIVIDFNRKRNVAGAGINMAQRVMSAADGNQILVGQPVFEILSHRESYMSAFRSYSLPIKHGSELPVHQLVIDSQGLNVDVPSQFQAPARNEKPLTRFAAYYIAHAVRSKRFVTSQMNRSCTSYVAKVLLWFLACDSTGLHNASESNPYKPHTWQAGTATLAEQFEYYYKEDFWLTCYFTDFINERLSGFRRLFSTHVTPGYEYLFPNEHAKSKIKSEFADIWDEIGLGSENVG
jgi:class 3 adenylate cyclase